MSVRLPLKQEEYEEMERCLLSTGGEFHRRTEGVVEKQSLTGKPVDDNREVQSAVQRWPTSMARFEWRAEWGERSFYRLNCVSGDSSG